MIVDTKKGKVEGITENGVAKFLGIPYAQAPVGKLRFQKTVSVQSWEGVWKADTFSAKCPQLSIPVAPDNGILQDEDCLYMNVYAPEMIQEPRPVFVWIYGGALMSGEGSTDVYEGSEFVRNGNLIVVTFNYRVGVFGGFYNFSTYPGCEEYEPNCGICDVLEALRFVKENIACFGGDPDRITIGGESAGAAICGLLLGMEEARGLFSRAALESTFPLQAVDPQEHEVTDKILQGAGFTAEHAAEFLMLSAEQINQAVGVSCNGNPLLGKASFQQTSFYQGSFQDYLRSMEWNVPILIGFNHDEGMIFLPPEAGKEQVDALTKNLFESTIDALLENKKLPLYLYRYDFVPASLKARGMGAIHSAEMSCVFHNLTCPGAAMMQADPTGAERVSRLMHTAWITFINGDSPWEAYQEDKACYMRFDMDSGLLDQGWRI